MTVIVCSLAAAVQGWDQTGSNGANLSFPVEFKIPTNKGAMVDGVAISEAERQKNDWIVGVVNSGPYLGTAFCGVWLTDPLNHYLGRRGTLFFCGIFCTFSVIGSAFTQNWYQLFVSFSPL